MGTSVTVAFVGTLPARAIGAVTGLFARWERVLSRFDPNSELSQVNRAGGRPEPAGALFRNVLSVALDAARATDGLFDPTLGRQMAAIGYDRSFEGPLRQVGRTFVREAPGGGWRNVEIDDATGTVTLPLGVSLDMGGIAKGMAVDAAATLLAEFAAGPALVNAGGDIRVVGDDLARWQVGLEPLVGQSVSLDAGALATSGSTTRRWTQNGVKRHHVIDPRTGLSSRSQVRTATVAAATCTQAEVAAKVALLLGPEAGRTFLEHHNLPGLLALHDGSIHTTSTWPSQVAA